MANSSINLIGLDFETIKQNLKTHFKNNSAFRDLNYEGSNINVLMEILAYNTYLNSFYMNMVASEMFLDTAELRDSIVSHAKELNYVPRSFSSATAVIDVEVTPSSNVSSVLIPKATSFTGRKDGKLYTFVTDRSFIVKANDQGVYRIDDMPIYEGIYVTDTFVYNVGGTQKFVLSNPTIDLASLAVAVIEDNGENQMIYTRADSLFGISATSKVFFVQPTVNGQYEIVFGDDTFGRAPKDGAVIVASYIYCNGELPNGIDTFVNDGPIDGHSNITITTIGSAINGSISESIESIRYNAPRAVATQERAVTTNDYKVLLQTRFPEIQSISVYGGENVDPPQYGKTFISVDIQSADGVPQSNKNVYLDFIRTRTPLTITPVIIDPEFTYVDVNTTVRYNVNITPKTPEEIKTLVQAAINQYNDTSINDFDSTLRYSQLIKTIDDADPSIVGNETIVKVLKILSAPLLELGISKNYTVKFDVPLSREYYVTSTRYTSSVEHTIESSTFTYQGKTCFLTDNAGIVNISTADGSEIVTVKSVGTVDYETGTVTLTNFSPSYAFGGQIKIYAVPASKDIFCRNNVILSILEQDIDITVERVRE